MTWLNFYMLPIYCNGREVKFRLNCRILLCYSVPFEIYCLYTRKKKYWIQNTDRADDVHQSCVRGFRDSKWPDVEGAQQQRGRQMQQGQKEAQSTHQTHRSKKKNSTLWTFRKNSAVVLKRSVALSAQWYTWFIAALTSILAIINKTFINQW